MQIVVKKSVVLELTRHCNDFSSCKRSVDLAFPFNLSKIYDQQPTCLLYIYHTYIIHISYIYHTYIIHISYIYHTCIIHISYIYHTYIIHISYIYHVFLVLRRRKTCGVLINHIFHKISIFSYKTSECNSDGRVCDVLDN